ncbi:Acyl carrier protein [Streptomyces alboniger]
MLVLVAPGQGAQTPGFLTPWLELPGVRGTLEAWSEAVQLDLIRYGTEGDAEEIRDTAVAQPLLVAAGLASAYMLFDYPADLPRKVGALAGHSVGELTAAALAGVLPAEETVRLVRARGLAMAEAAAVTHTGVSALLGGDPEVSVAHLEKLGLTPANVNGAGQIVAAGTLAEEILGLADIVNEIAGIPVEDVQLDKSFTDDLDVDSLSMVEVVVAAEERFDVKIPDEDVKNLKTVGDATSYILKHQA